MLLHILPFFVKCCAVMPFATNTRHIVTGPNTYHINKNENEIDVKENITVDYSNDLTVIQSVLDHIDRNGGGKVILGPGTYFVNGNIYVPSYTHLQGNGMEQTTIKLVDYAKSFIQGTSKKSGMVRAQYKTNIIISNITLDGNKDNQYEDVEHTYGRFGLFTEACNETWFDYVKIINFQGYGFDPHGKKPDKWGHNLFVTNCVANNNGYDGFTLDQSENIIVHNCEAHNNSRHGFNVVTGSNHIEITNCVSERNGFSDPYGGSGCGFMVQDTIKNSITYETYNAIIRNNIATNNKKAGICLTGIYNAYVKRNFIDNSCGCMEFVNTTMIVASYNKCLSNNYIRYVDKQNDLKDVIEHETYKTNNIFLAHNFYEKKKCYKFQRDEKASGTNQIVPNTIILLLLFCLF